MLSVTLLFATGEKTLEGFTSDIEIINMSSGKATHMKVVCTAQKTIVSFPNHPVLGNQVIINRFDKGVVWTCDKAKGEFFEIKGPSTREEGQSGLFFLPPNNLTFLGAENIDGRKVNKYGYNGNFIWKDALTFAPIKEERKGRGVVFLYKNTTLGVPPDYMFEVPAGYKKVVR